MPNNYIITIARHEGYPVASVVKDKLYRIILLTKHSCLELQNNKWIRVNHNPVSFKELIEDDPFIAPGYQRYVLDSFIAGLNKPLIKEDMQVIPHQGMIEFFTSLIDDVVNKRPLVWVPVGNKYVFDGYTLMVDDMPFDLPIGENYFDDLTFDIREALWNTIKGQYEITADLREFRKNFREFDARSPKINL